MTSAVAANAGWKPWSDRFFGAFGVAPLWVGAGLVALLAGVLVTVSWLSGDLQAFLDSGVPLHRQRDARIAVILCVFAPFLPIAQLLMLRFTETNVAALAPLQGGHAEPLRLPAPSFWLCTLPGVLAMPLVAFSIDRDLGFYLTRGYLSEVAHYFQWAVGLFATINVARISHMSLECGRAVGRRAEEIESIDLLDLSALAPFARQMLQTALLWLVMLSIFAVNAVDPGFSPAVVVIALYVAINVWVAWVASNRRVHERISETKEAELRRVNDALRGDRSAAAELRIDPGGGPLSAADLLAYRRFVLEVRESAFDAPAWHRALLYLAIPLGSWVGGALVERLLDASLQ